MSQPTPGPWRVGDTDWAAGYRIQAVVTSDAGDVAQVTTLANARLIAQAPTMREALELVLLFHSGGPWDDAKRLKWLQVTGAADATTKAMGDHIRAVLKAVEG